MNNVTFLGVEGSGKTVLTASLVNVFKLHASEGWYLRPDSREAFRFLEQAPSSLEGATLPHQTTALKRLAWSVQLNDETIRTMDVLDYPGEIYRLAFLDSKDDSDPATFAARVASNKEDIDAVLSHLLESDQVFVLFNLADAENIKDNSANLDAVWVTNSCLDYLSKLPNKPKVTLLLTQIDRYRDLQSENVNPAALVAKHLPLIHRNFPELDVISVSAIGPADATFGIDSIILRCLFECNGVQDKIRDLRKISRDVSAWMDAFKFESFAPLAVDSIVSMLNQCTHLSTEVPWFIPVRQLQGNGFWVNSDDIGDMLMVLALLKQVNLNSDLAVRLMSFRWLGEKLSLLELVSKEILSFRDELLAKVEKEEQFCVKELEYKRKFNRKCNIFLVIIAVVAVIELVIMFGRMWIG